MMLINDIQQQEHDKQQQQLQQQHLGSEHIKPQLNFPVKLCGIEKE